MTFAITDLVVVAVYIMLLMFLGFYVARQKSPKKNKEEFILAGRKLTLPFFVASLVATWYGNILGTGEFVYRNGLVTWICFGLPYYISAALFAVYFAKKIRKLNVSTIPEQIESKYGKSAGLVSSIIVLIITIPAAYILMLGLLIQIFLGVPLWICIIIGSVLSMAYLFTGGFRADIITNSAQFILMFTGFALLVIFTLIKFGMPSTLAVNLPVNHMKMLGGMSWQFLLVWFIISFQTFVDPSFHQRCSAAKTPGTAKKGVIISIAFWMLFDSMTLLTGLYAKAHFHIENPMMAFPVLGDHVLPVFFKGYFVVSLMAIVMSALDSYSFISGVTIGNDLLLNIKSLKIKLEKLSSKQLTQIGLAITSVCSVIMAISLPSAIQLIYKTSSIAIPGLLLPLVVSYSDNYYIEKKRVLWIMLFSSATALMWTVGAIFGKVNSIFTLIEPMIAGIIISVILALFYVRRSIK
jgi:SSS family solute:Na+ symporter